MSHPDAVSHCSACSICLPRHRSSLSSQSGRFTRALICKDNETNKHEPAVYLLLVPSDNQNTEAIAMPNRWLDRAVALLVYFKAMQPKQNECACFTHCFWMLLEGHSSFQWHFDSSERIRRFWMRRWWEDDNLTCYGTEGVDSRPNTSPYWCTKCCDTRHQQDGLSFHPRHATQTLFQYQDRTCSGSWTVWFGLLSSRHIYINQQSLVSVPEAWSMR